MTDLSEVYWYGKIFRYLFAAIDKVVYSLVSFIMEIFYLIAGSEIRLGNTVTDFFNRIQLILGIIVLFKLVISLFSGIVNPDSLSDEKKGIGNVIKRVVVVLVMIILIVPLNIPENDTADLNVEDNRTSNNQKTWNARMNESGILFGTMAELQSRILNGNVIPKLILGQDSSDQNEDISITLLKNFIFINLKPGRSDEANEDNWICPSNKKDTGLIDTVLDVLWGDIRLKYVLELLKNRNDQNAMDTAALNYLVGGEYDFSELEQSSELRKKTLNDIKREMLLEHVNDYCDLKSGWGGERYYLVYKYILSTVAGVLCFFMILSLTVEVAIRVFKLVVLRLISPIAILSYIDSKSEKTFNSWVKAVSTTYLDLFIRIAVISFILLLFHILAKVDFTVYSGNTNTITVIFARVILFIGLLYFAKEAPKFIMETLGIDSKGNMGIFSGIGKLRATKAVAGGVISGGTSKFNATKGNVGKKLISAIGGAVGGGVNTGKEFFKDGSDVNSIRNARRNYVNQNYERAADGSTFLGRRKTALFEGLGIKNDKQRYDDQIKHFEAATSAMQRMNNAFDGNGTFKFNTDMIDKNFQDIKDNNGNVIMSRLDRKGKVREYTLKEMKDILSRVSATGDEQLIRQVDSVMKKAQGNRLNYLRSLDRDDLVRFINDPRFAGSGFTENDLIVYDSAHRIYDIAQIYPHEAMFNPFYDENGQIYDFKAQGKNKQGQNILDWGATFKYAAGQSGKKAEAIKNSDEYFKASQDEKREQQKKNN